MLCYVTWVVCGSVVTQGFEMLPCTPTQAGGAALILTMDVIN